jgi:divalent metal cation (Fe/Co/Zn/Cd) transporter
VRRVLEQLRDELGIDCHPHTIALHRVAGEFSLAFHCTLDAKIPIADAHRLTERAESLLRKEVPNLGRVVIHVEPPEG